MATGTDNIQPASALRHDTVMNTDGEILGHVRDVVLDLDGGRIAYALISTAPMAESESRFLRVVPWELIHLDHDQGMLILDVQRDRIETAPSFEGDERPDMGDPHFQQEVYRHYGYLSGFAA